MVAWIRDQVEVVEREWIQDIASCEQSGWNLLMNLRRGMRKIEKIWHA